MSKLSIICLGAFLVLATINFISALPVPCPTGQIPENDRCVPVPTEKKDLMDQPTHLHEEIRKIRTVIQHECPQDQIMIRGRCRYIPRSS
jgi:hypothetical protein